MITVINCTNRRVSKTRHVAQHIFEYLDESQETRYLDLIDFPMDAIHPDMYEKEGQSESLAKLQEKYMMPADKFIFLIPEYNGGSPGILKFFIDACSARNYKETFNAKKALLIGISDGRAGNLRGIEQFTLILNFLGVTVYPAKQPISKINQMLNHEGDVTDEGTRNLIQNLVDEFVKF